MSRSPNPKTGTILYRYFAKSGELLYVGITDQQKRRHSSHKTEKTWASEIDSVETTEFPTRAEARAAEESAIRTERPTHNVESNRDFYSLDGSAKRSRDLRQRMRAAGFVFRHVWVHPKDWPRVKALIERLIAKRRKLTRPLGTNRGA